MNVIRQRSIHGNVNTELYNFVRSVPEGILFHSEHELRHPVGIYAVSTTRIFEAFENLLQAIEDIHSNYVQLSTEHIEVLDALMAYIDDGYHIMKTFFPKSSVKNNIIFADRWMMAINSKAITEYKTQLAAYRDRLALIVNRVKHNHGRYCHVEAVTMYGLIRGYYIEGVTNDGTIIPNLEIHPKFNGMHTAISYNFDIKNYLAYFYFISSLLSRALYKLIQSQHGITVAANKQIDATDDRILSICNRVSSLPDRFFPDELTADIAQVIVENQTGIVEFRKPAYASYMTKIGRQRGGYKFNTRMNADGVTRSWALPYFKG